MFEFDAKSIVGGLLSKHAFLADEYRDQLMQRVATDGAFCIWLAKTILSVEKRTAGMKADV